MGNWDDWDEEGDDPTAAKKGSAEQPLSPEAGRGLRYDLTEEQLMDQILSASS